MNNPMRGLVYLKKSVDTNDSIKRYNKLNFLRFVIINATSLANNQKEPAISTNKYVHEIFMGFFFLSKKIQVSFTSLFPHFCYIVRLPLHTKIFNWI